MRLGNREIGPAHKPFIVAEMSGNHNQSLDRACAIVKAAAEAGADAVKLQTYTADTMTLDLDTKEFFIGDPKSLWKGQSLYKLYQQAYTPWEWHKQLFEYANELGLVAFSTPFDETAVEFLESIEAPCYKIASFENTDLPLIRRVAATGKPIIISTGMASMEEIEEAAEAAYAGGCKNLVLLKCTSTYPATPKSTNLATLPIMRDRFKCEVGLSDHTMGIGAAVASVAFGAVLIEKHLTLRRADGGVDAAFSMEPQELAQLVTESERAHQALGSARFGATDAELKSLQYRRSIYVTADTEAGEIFTTGNIRCIRPGNGLAPKYYSEVLGRVARERLVKGTPLSWSLVE